MADDLGAVLGAITVAIADARRAADEETAVIAEYYAQHPLLKGMSAPRMRIPEISVELPVIVEGFEEGESGSTNAKGFVGEQLVVGLKAEFSKAGKPVPRGLVTAYRKAYGAALTKEPNAVSARKEYSRAAEEALTRVSKDKRFRRRVEDVPQLKKELRGVAETHAVKKPPQRPSFNVTVLTPQIKELTSPDSIARIHLTIREEGVEWTTVEQPDGSTTPQLVPE